MSYQINEQWNFWIHQPNLMLMSNRSIGFISFLGLWISTLTPRNTGRKGTNKFHLLLADFCYCQYRNDLKGPRFSILYWRISVSLGSGIAGFNCIWKSKGELKCMRKVK